MGLIVTLITLLCRVVFVFEEIIFTFKIHVHLCISSTMRITMVGILKINFAKRINNKILILILQYIIVVG